MENSGLTDGRIRLKPLAPSHSDGVRVLLDDPATQEFTRVPVPVPDDFADGWIRRYEEGRAEGTRVGFAIVEADGGFLGLALVPEIDHEASTAELGYVVTPAARGRGVATAALRLLSEWALGELGALRLELRISVGNVPSIRVAERCGYTREGVLRSVYLKRGVREDVEVWSLLPGELRPKGG
jgi:RimJ/RimL family protein N-acetyltransferase